MDSLDQKEMQPSGNKTLVAVFAVVVIAVAGWIIYAQSKKTSAEEPYPGSVPVVVESFDKRIARMGWKAAGYASEAEVTQASEIRKKKGDGLTQSDLDLIRTIVMRPSTHADGVVMVKALKEPKDQLAFYDVVKGLYQDGTPNMDFRKILNTWARLPQRPAVDKMMSDPDKNFALFVKRAVQQIDDPKGNMAA